MLLRNYEQLELRLDATSRSLWVFMAPTPRPCYTEQLLRELSSLQGQLERHADRFVWDNQVCQVEHVIYGSKVSGVFNLGGDLRRLYDSIRRRDAVGLRRYAKACIDVVYGIVMSYQRPVTTIAMIQGDALGGGFEHALSSELIVAERQAQLGFPEILFNLFPGMGAFNLLTRRLPLSHAESLIKSGRRYGAEELYDMGVIDLLVHQGEAEGAITDYLVMHSKRQHGYSALQKVRRKIARIDHDDLMSICEIWVDAALGLGERDLKVIERIIKGQDRMMERQRGQQQTDPSSLAV